MLRAPPWLATWLAIEALGLGLSVLRPPIREWTPGGWALGALVSALWLAAVWTAFSRLGRGRWIVAIAGAGALVSLLAVNVRTHLELGEFVTSSMLALTGSGGGPETTDVPSWLVGYLPPLGWLAAAAGTAWIAGSWIRSPRRGAVLPGVLAALGALAGVGWLASHRPVGHLPPDVSTFVALASIRSAPVPPPLPPISRREVRGAAIDAGTDVLVILVESWSRERLAAYGGPTDAMPSLEARLATETDAWTVFDRAYTVATATDLVLEAALTGVSPAAASEERGAAPLLWSFARAAGRRTLFVTPQSLDWGALPEVLDPRDLDRLSTRTELGGARVNDLGTDELLAADAMARELRSLPPEERLAAVYLTNALHEPFQTHSPGFRDPLGGSRYDRALRITDEAIDRILGALAETGRLERTLVVLIGDHGVTIDRKHPLPRLYGFYEEFVHVPMMVRLPASLRAARPALAAEMLGRRKSLVSTLDVLPTALDALGQPPAALDGTSLLGPLPADRRVVTVNANDRRQWEHEGFAVVWDDWRFLYTDLEGPQLFRIDRDPEQRDDLWPRAPAGIRAQIDRAMDERTVLRDIARTWDERPPIQ